MTKPTAHTVGYARTSTADQRAGLDAQMRDLVAAGATKIFSEQLSGKDQARPELERAIDFLREGDTFLATKLDRVARSAKDTLRIVDRVRERGATFRVLKPNDLILGPGDEQNAIPKAMLTIFSAIAEMEVDLMKERQREGIRDAQAKGKFVGRQPTARKKEGALLAAIATGLSPAAAALTDEAKMGRASAFRIVRAKREELQRAISAGRTPEEAARVAGVPWEVAKRILGPDNH